MTADCEHAQNGITTLEGVVRGGDYVPLELTRVLHRLTEMAAPSVSEVDICNFAFEGRLEMVRASLDKNPELIDKTDSSKRSALHWACSAGRDDVVRLLLSNKGAQVSTCVVQL